MRPADLERWLENRIFRPFRLHLSNGASFEVREPGQITVTGSTALLTLPAPGVALVREVEISLVHITHLEPIAPSTLPSSN